MSATKKDGRHSYHPDTPPPASLTSLRAPIRTMRRLMVYDDGFSERKVTLFLPALILAVRLATCPQTTIVEDHGCIDWLGVNREEAMALEARVTPMDTVCRVAKNAVGFVRTQRVAFLLPVGVVLFGLGLLAAFPRGRRYEAITFLALGAGRLRSLRSLRRLTREPEEANLSTTLAWYRGAVCPRH